MNIESIRRAVSIARYHDQRANDLREVIRERVESGKFLNDDYLVEVEMNANNIWHHAEIAVEVRRAIRQAMQP